MVGVVELELFAGGLLWGTTRAQEGQNCRNGVLSVPKQLSTTVLSNHTRSPLSEFVPMAVFGACELAQSRDRCDRCDRWSAFRARGFRGGKNSE